MKPWQYRGKDFDASDINGAQGFLYVIFFPNGKRYVGIKTFNIGWKRYAGSGKRVLKYLKEYGSNGIHRVILELFNDYVSLSDAERETIRILDAVKNPLYYNQCHGGQGRGWFNDKNEGPGESLGYYHWPEWW